MGGSGARVFEFVLYRMKVEDKQTKREDNDLLVELLCLMRLCSDCIANRGWRSTAEADGSNRSEAFLIHDCSVPIH